MIPKTEDVHRYLQQLFEYTLRYSIKRRIKKAKIETRRIEKSSFDTAVEGVCVCLLGV